MAVQRFAILNPDGKSYRVSLINGRTFRLDGSSMVPCIFGSVADRIGHYERLGYEPEELEEILKRHGYVKK